jgi:nucleotide-binding universal stress UspA family protein
MRTILVPTDFSKLSKVGLSYAIGLAKKLEARVIVISVVTGVTGNSQELSNVKKYRESMLATAQSDGDKFLKEFKSEAGKVDLSFKPVGGFPVDAVIEEFARKNKVNLIVMSSKGATGLKKIVMGSNAAAVIDNSSRPVLVIPGEASPKAISKFVYATDAREFKKEMNIVTVFAEAVGASVEVVHVVPEKKKEQKETISELKLKAASSYPKIHLHTVYDKDVAAGLEDFITHRKDAFILVTFTHRLSLNEKLFGKSVTQELAYHNSVPLLVVNKSNHKAFKDGAAK